jgi:hypothetical protein
MVRNFTQNSVYIRTNKSNLAYLSAIFESYEGLATMTSLNGQSGMARITFFSHFAKDIDGLLYALNNEVEMKTFLTVEEALTGLSGSELPADNAAAV